MNEKQGEKEEYKINDQFTNKLKYRIIVCVYIIFFYLNFCVIKDILREEVLINM